MLILMIIGIVVSLIAIAVILLRIRSSKKKEREQQATANKRAALDEALRNTMLDSPVVKKRTIRLTSPTGTFMYEEDACIKAGRAPENDLCIADMSVSKQHFSIYRLGESIIIEDMASRNGTLIRRNGKIRRLLSEREVLEQNDTIIAGAVEFEYMLLDRAL